MKKKFSRILGVGLTLVMVLALAVAIAPADTPSAEAALTKLQWSKVPLPRAGDGGKYALMPDTNVGPIAIAPDGSVVFASSENSTDNALLMKSTDGGVTWKEQTGFDDATASKTDTTAVVDMALSPEYGSDTTVYVATANYVYVSTDGGKKFRATNDAEWTGETIQDIDVAMDSGGRLAIIVGTSDAGLGGDVYVNCPATTGSTWQAQLLGATYDVRAVGFSPLFAGEEGIFAVTVNATATQIQSSYGNTESGAGWGANIGPGSFLDKAGGSMIATRARIAFPDNFDVDSLGSNIAFVGLMVGTSDGLNGSEKGDVYKVVFQATRSSTIDLDVRGVISALNPTATNIWSIDASGDAEAATIMVGTDFWSSSVSNYYWTAYYSTDSGATWSAAREKMPTGGTLAWNTDDTAFISGSSAATNVVMSPDDSSVALASTKGARSSAISRTVDGGKSWNQVSLIDYSTSYGPVVASPSSPYPTTNTLRVITTVSGGTIGGTANIMGSIWQTTNAGASYERIFSYANPTATSQLSYLYVTGSTYFGIDKINGKFFRSSDAGVTWPRVITAKDTGIGQYTIVDANTIYTVYSGGGDNLWYTTNLGRPWVKPEETFAGTPKNVSVKGDSVAIGTSEGNVYFSNDGGDTFDLLGITAPYGGAGGVRAVMDGKYADNHMMYAIVEMSTGGGIWRCVVDPDDPGSAEWKQIDNIDSAGNIDQAARSLRSNLYVGMELFGVFYATDYVTANRTPVDDYAGGVWRSVNPTADTDGVNPPSFYRETNGLTSGVDKVIIIGAAVYPTTLFCLNSAAPNYYDKLVALTDTLGSPVAVSKPVDAATGEGIRLSTTSLYMTVTFAWEATAGAIQYELQVADDTEFKSRLTLTDSGLNEGQVVDVTNIIPGKKYFWRVRVTEPLKSPWSEVRSFTASHAIALGAVELLAPSPGAPDVSLLPTFAWSPVTGATGYTFQIAKDAGFTIPGWTKTGIMTNAYLAEQELEYSTTYYWRARAQLTLSPATYTDWAVGILTTLAEPAEVVPPVVVEPPLPPEIVEVPISAAIPSYLLWTIIVIGAVLFIALIVLIVRTRRVI